MQRRTVEATAGSAPRLNCSPSFEVRSETWPAGPN